MAATAEFTVYKGSSNGRILRSSTRRPGPMGNQVLVRITHSGLCGTDEHYKCTDMVLGHEGVGVVEQVGTGVLTLKVGERVGWGYCHGCCGFCQYCLQGLDLYCDDRQLYGTGNFDQGSFGTYAVWSEKILVRIPDALESAHAAPLMCAGAAVYSAIKAAGIAPSQRVGVIGIGGLGHLAIQFLKKMGCEVVGFSHTGEKKADALQYGCSEFHTMTPEAEGSRYVRDIDVTLVTTSHLPPWGMILPAMKRGGIITLMTVDQADLQIPNMDILMNGLRIQGSLPAPRYMLQEMLHFAAFHGIAPTIESYILSEDGIARAMEKLRHGKMRYRGVFKV